MATFLVIFLILLLLGGGLTWACWEMGIGPVGSLKRQVRFEQAKQRADEIALDAERRIRRL